MWRRPTDVGTVGRRQESGGDAADAGSAAASGALALPLPGFHKALELEYLGGGVARAGYVMPDPRYVLKVAHRERTRCHNLAEARVYAEAPEHIKRWLAPVVDCGHDGSWLVVERARCGSDLTYDERVQACDAVNAAIGRWFFDLHEGNVGIMPDGRYVATDYGFGAMQSFGESSDSPAHSTGDCGAGGCPTCWHRPSCPDRCPTRGQRSPSERPVCPTGRNWASTCGCTTCCGGRRTTCGSGVRTTDCACPTCANGFVCIRCGAGWSPTGEPARGNCPACDATPRWRMVNRKRQADGRRGAARREPTGFPGDSPGCPCTFCRRIRAARADEVARRESAARVERLAAIRRLAADAAAQAPSLPF